VASETVTPIDILSVEAVDVVHHARDIRLRRVQDLMVVIAYQRIAEALRAEFFESDRNNFEEPPPIAVVREDGLLAIASRHDVVDRPGEPNA
jgi:hypothetical protein